ncbi:protein of unknown function (plasmid) [Cupriavidus taiwanensis]|uniref:Uncharacterized protein n=1 Tax=Cupriavidus taiwanensis TaxID=164546 RepID=A0A375IU37_9BURK|nr:protein of unknown function [Cupriavidus taiwanensis]
MRSTSKWNRKSGLRNTRYKDSAQSEKVEHDIQHVSFTAITIARGNSMGKKHSRPCNSERERSNRTRSIGR